MVQRKNIQAKQDGRASEKDETDEQSKQGEQQNSIGRVFSGSQTATDQTTGGGEDGNWKLAPGSGVQNVDNK